jgi:Aldehyde dehydrogenase family
MLLALCMPLPRRSPLPLSGGGGVGARQQRRRCGGDYRVIVGGVAPRLAASLSTTTTTAAAAAAQALELGRRFGPYPPLPQSPILEMVSAPQSRYFSSSSSSLSSASTLLPPPPPPVALRGGAADWIDASTQTYKIFTDNQFVTVPVPSSSSSFDSKPLMEVKNPANQEFIGVVPDTSDALLDDVVSKAVKAFDEWKAVPVQQRQRVFFDYVKLIKEHKQTLAELICVENGKTLADAHGDVFRGLEVAETAANVAPLMLGDSLMNISTNMDCTSYRFPLGVCSAICPFNFPAMVSL